MEKFFVITNAQKDPELTVTRGIKEYLEEKGKTCLIPEKNPAADAGYRYTDARLIPGHVDCVLVVGGDGTLLQASRDLRGRDIPLLGINMGTLGYLAEIDRGGIRTALDRLIGGNYTVESRMMLSGCCERKGRVLLEDVALNDIVIGRCGRLRVVDFDIYVNGEFLNACSADGIIISTATGSTGYSLSVGGPIVSPEASLILISYIAPHTLNSRSIVLPADARVTVKVAGGHTGAEEGAEASFDGDTSVRLALGDTVTVSRSELVTKMVKTNNVSFLEVLRRKMSS